MVDETLKAIEITGTVDEQRRLRLDEPLPVESFGRVRVIILMSDEAAAEEREWLRSAAVNPAFDFLKDSEEDIYAPNDGQPFGDKG